MEQGIKEACESGIIAGYPLIDVKVRLKSMVLTMMWILTEMAFKIAGSIASSECVWT